MRGTHSLPLCGYTCRRFIPARAGNTRDGSANRVAPAVHPRPCGEHCHLASCRAKRGGSSPPVRGTLGRVLMDYDGNRFIPARAGNTALARLIQRIAAIRKRWLYKALIQLRNLVSRPTKPPDLSESRDAGIIWPTRQWPPASRRRRIRFIPARAGNTAQRSTAAVLRSVHPRPCGEHRPHEGEERDHGGSSPPVRGTRLVVSPWTAVVRFIPARLSAHGD